MSHIEIKRVNDEEYASFVKKKRIMGKTLRINEHIGKNVPTLNKNDYMLRNLDRISEKELALRTPFLEGLDISYGDSLPNDVELLSIKLDNLIEARGNKETVLVEFAKEFIFNSNNIEGSRIPAKEVKKIIETGDSRYENANEVKEVFNSIDAMELHLVERRRVHGTKMKTAWGYRRTRCQIVLNEDMVRRIAR